MSDLTTASLALNKKRWANKTQEERRAETEPMRKMRWHDLRAAEVKSAKAKLAAEKGESHE